MALPSLAKLSLDKAPVGAWGDDDPMPDTDWAQELLDQQALDRGELPSSIPQRTAKEEQEWMDRYYYDAADGHDIDIDGARPVKLRKAMERMGLQENPDPNPLATLPIEVRQNIARMLTSLYDDPSELCTAMRRYCAGLGRVEQVGPANSLKQRQALVIDCTNPALWQEAYAQAFGFDDARKFISPVRALGSGPKTSPTPKLWEEAFLRACGELETFLQDEPDQRFIGLPNGKTVAEQARSLRELGRNAQALDEFYETVEELATNLGLFPLLIRTWKRMGASKIRLSNSGYLRRLMEHVGNDPYNPEPAMRELLDLTKPILPDFTLYETGDSLLFRLVAQRNDNGNYQVPMLKALMRRGADANKPRALGMRGQSPLAEMIYWNNANVVDLVRLMLDTYKADPNGGALFGLTRDEANALRYTVARRPPTPLWRALHIQRGSERGGEVVQMLMSHGADPELYRLYGLTSDVDGVMGMTDFSCLSYAMFYRSAAVVGHLLNGVQGIDGKMGKRANLLSRNTPYQRPVLHYLVDSCKRKQADVPADYGNLRERLLAILNLVSNAMSTWYQMPASSIAAGEFFDAQDHEHGNTIMHVAATLTAHGGWVMRELNQATNASIVATNRHGRSPLAQACVYRNVEAANYLLDQITDTIDEVDVNGDTPIQLFVRDIAGWLRDWPAASKKLALVSRLLDRMPNDSLSQLQATDEFAEKKRTVVYDALLQQWDDAIVVMLNHGLQASYALSLLEQDAKGDGQLKPSAILQTTLKEAAAEVAAEAQRPAPADDEASVMRTLMARRNMRRAEEV